MNGHPLTIRSRIPTGIHAATISVAQIEFAARKNRHEVTKLDEKEDDAATEIRLCTALDKKPLKYRLLLMVVFMLLNESASRSRQPRSQAASDDCQRFTHDLSKASRFAYIGPLLQKTQKSRRAKQVPSGALLAASESLQAQNHSFTISAVQLRS